MDKPQSTELLFEISHPGRRCHRLPECDVPADADACCRATPSPPTPPPLAGSRRDRPGPPFRQPLDAEHVDRHQFLSAGVVYHEVQPQAARTPGRPARHGQPASAAGRRVVPGHARTCSGRCRTSSPRSPACDAVSLQPAAGAQGELTALLVAAAYFRDRGEQRTRVLIPDSAHGTNPASAAIAGFDAVTIKSNARGLVDLDDLRAKLDERTAVFMITNPNTLGLFDEQIATITELLHGQGGLVYLDGANMNAILGITRPGDFGADMMHYNVHKTFTGPHGAGGPGAGPIAVRRHLAPFLPAPVVVERRRALPARLRSAEVDRPGAQLLRQRRHPAARLLLHPHARPRRTAAGQRERGAQRQLPAQPPQARLRGAARRPLHARVRRQRPRPAPRAPHQRHGHRQAAARLRLPRADGVFPAGGARGADDRADRDGEQGNAGRFADALLYIRDEDPDFLHQAPHTLGISRPDEVKAAKEPILRWKP